MAGPNRKSRNSANAGSANSRPIRASRRSMMRRVFPGTGGRADGGRSAVSPSEVGAVAVMVLLSYREGVAARAAGGAPAPRRGSAEQRVRRRGCVLQGLLGRLLADERGLDLRGEHAHDLAGLLVDLARGRVLQGVLERRLDRVVAVQARLA